MRAIVLTLAGIAAAACGAILAPAALAEAAGESAQLTIATLEAQGSDVRNPKEQKRLVRRDDDLIEVVDRRTITVSLDCSRR